MKCQQDIQHYYIGVVIWFYEYKNINNVPPVTKRKKQKLNCNDVV